ncbi:MAG: WYL domain-containing protein [Mediterranea sp.]|jgi:hypothetical protein|nr:WYL domain-containing protein [Mediterranea sp.]
MVKDIFTRYIWLTETIHQAGRITLSELNNRWLRTDMSEGKEIAERTFHRYRTAIEEIFDINIACDKRSNEYYIEDVDDVEHKGLRAWLLDTFTVSNLLHESHNLRHRILMEDIPSGRQFLTTIIHAMRDGKVLQMAYQPFWQQPITYHIAPYCIKLFKQRWYVVARRIERDVVRIYSLDRMRSLQPTAETFEVPANFSGREFFMHSFGIVTKDDTPPCTVYIKVYGRKRDYIRTLPLHSSQEEIEIAEAYSIFSYYLAPTADFVQEILSYGNQMEVTAPDSLRMLMAQNVKQMYCLYHAT